MPTPAARAATTGDRPHLGASLLGHDCLRYLFYVFRWQTDPPEGRLARLFETGHREEARIIAELRAIGVDVHDRDPVTGDQYRFTALGGHMAGSFDGIIESGLLEAPKARDLLELKTSNARQFAELQRKGVAAAKPLHRIQIEVYLAAFGLERPTTCACARTPTNCTPSGWRARRGRRRPLWRGRNRSSSLAIRVTYRACPSIPAGTPAGFAAPARSATTAPRRAGIVARAPKRARSRRAVGPACTGANPWTGVASRAVARTGARGPDGPETLDPL